MTPTRRRDIDALQGTWRVVAFEMDGTDVPAGVYAAAAITIQGDSFTSQGMGYSYAGTVTLEPAANPAAFDLVFTEGPPAGLTNRGIYRLQGDEWTICLATRGDARPKRFATHPDSGHALERLVRERSGDRAPSPAGDIKEHSSAKRADADQVSGPDVPATTSAGGDLEGDWAMVSAVLSGVPLAPEMVKWCRRITRGNTTRVVAGPQTMLDATFALDSSHTPAHIDYVNRGGSNAGKSQAGIYELRDGVLRICVAAPGAARPDEFSSVKGDGRSFTEWRR